MTSARVCKCCGCAKSRVTDVRDKYGVVLRSRECTRCGHRWQTVEVERWIFERMGKDGRGEGY